ncbi:cation diffusion facilitator family transporter [Thiothrix nivea]|uniref:Cation diffusion facilitator family transporter n=1 Tax=Thiothrix nivea (strain ATCC 35100 / DSM 5205 / JP2) TaxID=870187 RepID=A0A656HH43_THINJ|nr:cation diffusion facilitator family transporter [Thiothrix nivea]EIJ35747.1 cation diffusion facilitator family transporter [Thiothrix nivea DSM 5205]
MSAHHHHTHHIETLPETPRISREERQAATRKVTLVGAALNTVLSLAQIAGGFLTQSQALIADGFHSLSDLASDFVVLLASHLAHQEADDNHPYGHGRIETLATVILGLMLAGVAVAIFLQAWGRLFSGAPLPIPQAIAIAFAAIAIIGKEALYHYTMHTAKRIHSPMLKANAWHHRSDAISSVVVLVGIAGAQFGFPWLDPLAAMVVAVMILYMAGQLIMESTSELVDTGLAPEEVQEIHDFIAEIEGVENVHLLRTRRMGGHVLADAHLQVNGRISVSEGHFISDQVMYRLRKRFPDIKDVIIHIDPEDDETAHPCQNLPSRKELLDALEAVPGTASLWPHIRDIDLHYIAGKIQLEIILDSAPPSAALIHFENACKTITCIQQINFMHKVSAQSI